MHTRFYLHIAGNREIIQSVQNDLALEGAEIMPRRITNLDEVSLKDNIWMWRTPYQECITEYPEDELASYLRVNKKIAETISMRRTDLKEVIVMIVCEIDEHEVPHGFSISANLISLLHFFSATLEIDIVPSIPERAGSE